MAVTEKQEKVRLYKVAKELNLSHDTLIDFLSKKGFDVKNHMSVIDGDMIEIVQRHFKKEKVDAERHAKKRKEYDEQDRRRRGEKEPSAEEEAPVAETAPKPKQPAPPVAPPPPVEVSAPVEIPAVEEKPEPQVPFVVEAPPVPKEKPVELPKKRAKEEQPVVAAAPEVVEAPLSAETIEVPAEVVEAAAKPKKKEMDVSLESSMPKMGLTVKGKIDLKARMKELRDKLRPEPGKPSETPAGATADEKPKHKKKKKKRIVADKPVTTESPESEAAKARAAKKGKKGKVREVDAAEVKSAIKRTIAAMGDYGPVSQRAVMRRRKRARREEEERQEFARSEVEKRTLRIYEYATVSEIASLMNINVAQVISSLINLGIMASINQRLDMDTITLVASEYGFEVQPFEDVQKDSLEDLPDEEETLRTRPPIVTIMGHVDHGKTSLLDYIRSANVVAGESGGITQHIGAYTVQLDSGRKITFLDTPGHEAFTAMRARGAQVTDIVVLVVAADDNVMPQTVEAINHALAANVPIVIAINKIDKAEANPERIKQQLADRNILVEDWGGRYGAIPISAKKGINVDQLLDRILLESDIRELRANPDRFARGYVIESQLDRGRGIIATVLVQKGTLRVGDSFVAGNEYGKVRALMDERLHRVEEAPPATPVQVLGFNGLPQAGDVFVVVESDRGAREIAGTRAQIKRETDFRKLRRVTLDDISEQIKIGGVRDLSIIVKGDVDGSVEALSDSLLKLSTPEVRVDVIHKGVGAISESDVLLASASDAIIIGFHVRPNLNARRLAEAESIDIRLYEIIYDVIDDVKKALEGLLQPEISERVTATVLVRETFKISKIGTIAGCYVQDGKIHRNNRVRLVRDGFVVFTGSILSLKRFKDDARDVDTGFECGISLDGFNDIKAGDVIEAYESVETKRSLA